MSIEEGSKKANLDNIQGGSATLQELAEDNEALLDFSRVETLPSPHTMDGSEDAIYENKPGTPFFFAGGYCWEDSEDDMNNAESWVVKVYVNTGTVGTPDWSKIWESPAITGGLPDPVVIAVPSGRAEDTGLNIPIGFWNDGRGVRVTVQQTVEGDGYYDIQHSFVDGVRGS